MSRSRALDAASVLHRLKLAERRPDSRLRMITPLREAVRLDIKPFSSDRRRIIRHYVPIAELAGQVGTSVWREIRPRVHAEADNLDSVCALAIASGEVRNVARGLVGLGDLVRMEGIGSSSSLEDGAKALETMEMYQSAASVYGTIGRILESRMNYETAKVYFEKSNFLARPHSLVQTLANNSCSLGLMAMLSSQHVDAEKYLRDALFLYEKTGDKIGLANIYQYLGDLESHKQDNSLALEFYQKSLETYRSRETKSIGEGNVLICIADLGLTDGENLLKEARQVYADTAVVSSEAFWLVKYGALRARSGQISEAMLHFHHASEIARRLARPSIEAEAFVRQAQVANLALAGSGKAYAEAGFSIWFDVLAANDVSKPGWQALHRALTESDKRLAASHLAEARGAWSEIGRFDLIRLWIEFP